MFKQTNVGSTDRTIRIVVGALLIAAPYFTDFAFWSNPLARYAIPLVGLILLVTALVRFCPLYRIVGVRTCS
ncbi:MAG: YgaP family membrane protein [Hyphomicrobiaceae bacterium]